MNLYTSFVRYICYNNNLPPSFVSTELLFKHTGWSIKMALNVILHRWPSSFPSTSLCLHIHHIPSVPSFYVVTIGSILWCSFNSFHKSPIQTFHKQYKKTNMVKLLLFMMNMKQKYLTFYLLDSLAFLGGRKTPTPALHKTPKVIS